MSPLREDLRGFARYARELRGFLSEPMPEHRAREMIARNLASRERRLLTLLEGGVFGNPRGPYRVLFDRAGIELGDVRRMVRDDGIEPALSRLREAGVWLSLAEAKGRQPVRRGDWEMEIRQGDLHNRLASRHFEGRSGGSRSVPSRFWVDLGDVLETSAYAAVARHGFGLDRADGAIWFPAPPGVAGVRRALWWSKAGMEVRRWFAQTVPRWRPGEIRHAAFVRWTASASRRAGRPMPLPERTPPADARRVARWLSTQSGGGSPAVLFTTPSSAARVCSAAAEADLGIAGTFFSLGGEPHTETKAKLIGSAGCRAESSYYVSEIGGPVALGCPAATTADEAHLAADRVAVVKGRPLPGDGSERPLYLTAISPLAPQVAINLEIGDYAVEGSARCGCPFAQAGLSRTVRAIRSYEKLSTEGMHFVGPELVTLLEDELPRRFGGGPTDYQLIEEESTTGRSRICLAVAPGVGPLDEARVSEVALAFLRSAGGAERMMAEVWSAADTLRVERRPPEVSGGGKVLPLHVSRSRSRAARQ